MCNDYGTTPFLRIAENYYCMRLAGMPFPVGSRLQYGNIRKNSQCQEKWHHFHLHILLRWGIERIQSDVETAQRNDGDDGVKSDASVFVNLIMDTHPILW